MIDLTRMSHKEICALGARITESLVEAAKAGKRTVIHGGRPVFKKIGGEDGLVAYRPSTGLTFKIVVPPEPTPAGYVLVPDPFDQ